MEIWSRRKPFLSEMHHLMPGEDAAKAFSQASDAMQQVHDLASRGKLMPTTWSRSCAAMLKSTATLAEAYTKFGQQPPPVYAFPDPQQARGLAARR